MKEIPINTVVHISTEKEAQEFCDFINNNNYYIEKIVVYYTYKDKLCYKFNKENITHCDFDWYLTRNYHIISYKEFKEKYMKTPNEVRIEIPEGMCIDKENSTFECIKFKPKKLTYEDIAKKLFYNKTTYYPNSSKGTSSYFTSNKEDYINCNNCYSEIQVKKLMAINKLINVAHYLNGDWEPNYKNSAEPKYYITYNFVIDYLQIEKWYNSSYGTPCFKSLVLAKQAIEILGEETIKLALSNV